MRRIQRCRRRCMFVLCWWQKGSNGHMCCRRVSRPSGYWEHMSLQMKLSCAWMSHLSDAMTWSQWAHIHQAFWSTWGSFWANHRDQSKLWRWGNSHVYPRPYACRGYQNLSTESWTSKCRIHRVCRWYDSHERVPVTTKLLTKKTS